MVGQDGSVRLNRAGSPGAGAAPPREVCRMSRTTRLSSIPGDRLQEEGDEVEDAPNQTEDGPGDAENLEEYGNEIHVRGLGFTRMQIRPPRRRRDLHT